jgi:hypothetical protein
MIVNEQDLIQGIIDGILEEQVSMRGGIDVMIPEE